MNTYEIAILITAIIAASIGFCGAAFYNVGKSRGQYNRGWNAGKQFARNNPDL